MVNVQPGTEPEAPPPNDADEAPDASDAPPVRARRPLDLSGLNPAQYEAVTLPPGPVLVIAGRGFGQDPRAHAPARVSRQRARRVAVRDPRDHVHQQGRGRDAGARRRPRRSGRAPHVGVDLPRRVLAHPAPRGEPARLPVELHDLRPGGRAAVDRLGAPRPEPRPEALPGRGAARPDQRAEERARAARTSTPRWPSRPASAGSRTCTPSTSGACRKRPRSTSTICSCSRCGSSVSTPKPSQRYRNRFRHILVDEFQDTNAAQFELVRLLAQDHRSVMVVGDVDQSIYKFRGADFRNLIKFEDAFPEATTVVLDQNYRSTQRILDAANAVIENNASRRAKHLWTDQGAGEPIVRFQGDDEHDEAAFVVREIHRLVDDEQSPLRRHRGLLPHERAEPRRRRVARSLRHPVPRVRRREVLRPARDQGHARVPPRAREPRRRSVVEAHRQHAAARCRRHVGREDRLVREWRRRDDPRSDPPRGRGWCHGQGTRLAARICWSSWTRSRSRR